MTETGANTYLQMRPRFREALHLLLSRYNPLEIYEVASTVQEDNIRDYQKAFADFTPMMQADVITPMKQVDVIPPAVAVPMILYCPMCSHRHIDAGEFETKIHHTHACQLCGHVWRPAIVPTVGVPFLPGFKDAT